MIAALLLAAALQCPDGTPPPCRSPQRAAAPRANSVAVLYFENNSPDTGDVYLADGLTDELITQLGRIERLAVAPRSAVRRFRGRVDDPATVARGLAVSHVVTGSVRRAGASLRVDVELVRMPAQQRLWGESYRRSDGDLFAIQEDIARAVTQAVAGTLLPAERSQLARAPTRDPAAYDLFLRSSSVFADVSPASLQRALAVLESALRRDPSFTAARGRLAYVYGWAANWRLAVPGLAPDSLVPVGLRIAEQAVREDSLSYDAWMGRSFLLFFRDPPDYDGALAAAYRATRLDSSASIAFQNLAVLLRRTGRFADALRAYHRCLEVEIHQQCVSDIGFIYYSQRDYRAALRWYDSAIVIAPANWIHYQYRSHVRLALGDLGGALDDARAAVQLADEGTRYQPQMLLARVEAVRGDTAAARLLLEPLARRFASGPVSVRDGNELVTALNATGQRERALEVLERIRPRGAWLWSYLVFPVFDGLRGEPAFQRVFSEARPPGAPPVP